MNILIPEKTDSYDIGLGLTTRCNASCKHCYSKPMGRETDISFQKVKDIVQSVGIKSINMGTGESGLHPQFSEIFEFLVENISEISITSNGFTLSKMSDQQIMALHDVDISLDFPIAHLHDSFRGRKLFDLAVEQIHRCKDLNILCSIATAVTTDNIDHLMDMLTFVRSFDMALRLNLYKEIGPKDLTPSYEKFWSIFKIFFNEAKIVSCSEPILRVVLGLKDDNFEGSPCSINSIRIRPNGKIHRCVYLSGSQDIGSMENGNIRKVIDALEHPRYIPTECVDCKHIKICQGGCESRRILHSGIEKPDMYCPYLRGDDLHIEPNFDASSVSEEYIHSSYLCTLIVK